MIWFFSFQPHQQPPLIILPYKTEFISILYINRMLYTQVTSICLIQSEVTELNSRKTTKRNSELFPSCLTQEVGSVTRSQRASVLSSQTLLTILNVEPLYLRIVAAPEN